MQQARVVDYRDRIHRAAEKTAWFLPHIINEGPLDDLHPKYLLLIYSSCYMHTNYCLVSKTLRFHYKFYQHLELAEILHNSSLLLRS